MFRLDIGRWVNININIDVSIDYDSKQKSHCFFFNLLKTSKTMNGKTDRLAAIEIKKYVISNIFRLLYFTLTPASIRITKFYLRMQLYTFIRRMNSLLFAFVAMQN